MLVNLKLETLMGNLCLVALFSYLPRRVDFLLFIFRTFIKLLFLENCFVWPPECSSRWINKEFSYFLALYSNNLKVSCLLPISLWFLKLKKSDSFVSTTCFAFFLVASYAPPGWCFFIFIVLPFPSFLFLFQVTY